MANICENRMYVQSEDEQNLKVVKDYFKDWNGAVIEDIDNDCFEVYFDSRWDFPLAEMQELIRTIPNVDDIYMKCLSVEWGGAYCQFNEYDGSEDWYTL